MRSVFLFLFHLTHATPDSTSNGAGQFDMVIARAHAALLLNCECQLFAANIFKSIRWLDVHDAGDTDGQHQTDDERHEYARPNWCGRESNAVNCRIETFTCDVRLSLWMKNKEEKKEMKEKWKSVQFIHVWRVISMLGRIVESCEPMEATNRLGEKWGKNDLMNLCAAFCQIYVVSRMRENTINKLPKPSFSFAVVFLFAFMCGKHPHHHRKLELTER